MPKINFSDIEIFEGKSLDDLLKQIHNNSEEKGKKISHLIDQLSQFVTGPDDAALLVPLLAEYLDVAVKNDEQLIKLATVVQRYLGTLTKSDDGESSSLPPLDEIQQLLQNRKEQAKIVKMGNG